MKEFVFLLLVISSGAVLADWAAVPDLESSELWRLVAEGRAEVVSSVGFGSPDKAHSKQTVFKILKAEKNEGAISWAINPDGSYRAVMCDESWVSRFEYLGSSCSIPGCAPDNEKCITEITKNR